MINKMNFNLVHRTILVEEKYNMFINEQHWRRLASASSKGYRSRGWGAQAPSLRSL